MKIMFFGTANVALPILEIISRHHEIAAVVTSPDAPVGRKREFAESPVSVLANEMNLKVMKPDKVKGNDLFRMELQNMGADIFVVVAYGKILPKEIIDMPRLKTVNVHFSLLPKYRGSSPIQTALLNGEEKTGTTIFILDEKVDHGPILAQVEAEIDPDDNYITLSQKMAMHSANLIVSTLADYGRGLIQPKQQDDSQATFTEIITKQDGKIDWNKTAQEIYNKYRAFYPWPGLWTTWNGKKIKITECLISQYSFNDQPAGTVMENGIVICGQGTALEVANLQLEGKTETGIMDFLNGYPQFVGSRLE